MGPVINMVKKASRFVFGLSCLAYSIGEIIFFVTLMVDERQISIDSLWIMLATGIVAFIIPAGIFGLRGKKRQAGILFGAALAFELFLSMVMNIGIFARWYTILYSTFAVLAIIVYALSREDTGFSSVLGLGALGIVDLLCFITLILGIVGYIKGNPEMLGFEPFANIIIGDGDGIFLTYLFEAIFAPIMVLFGYIYLYDRSLNNIAGITPRSSSSDYSYSDDF